MTGRAGTGRAVTGPAVTTGRVRTRRATRADAGAVAALAQAHYGGDLGTWTAQVAGCVAAGERVLLAEVDGQVVAYAKAGRRAPTEPGDPAPAGTWLTGAVTAPAHRRQGLARRLIRLLLAELLPTGAPVWSMTNARNTASLALQHELGLVEVLRAPRMLGEDFAGGQGVLLRADPPR